MDSFRGLADLPARMGLTVQGGTVQALPYSEGQLFVTITDDWRRIRCEPQVHTFGCRFNLAAGANFNIAALAARRVPLRLIYADVNTDPAAGDVLVSRTSITGLVQTTSAPIVPLEVGTSTNADADPMVFAQVGAPFLNPLGFRLFPGAHENRWLPRLLLPGEFLVFQVPVAASVLNLQLVWEELTNAQTDVLTSKAPLLP